MGLSSRLPLIGLLVCAFALLEIPAPPRSARTPAGHRQLYAAPAGRPHAAGTSDDPLRLSDALSDEGPVRPGDTVWLRGGVYRGTFESTLQGTAEAPIVIRQLPGERAIIDSEPSPKPALTVLGRWTTFRDFEITNSDRRRHVAEAGPWPEDLRRGAGVFAKGPNNAFVNLVVHDMGDGFGVWEEASDTIVYGNVIFFNGWEGPDRAHGHGIYTQNRVGVREIADNIVFWQFSHGIHAYGSSAASLDHIELRGNVVFGNGAIAASGGERDILLGGGRRAVAPLLEENVTFGAQNNLGYAAGCEDGVVRDNYFVAPTPLMLVKCEPEMTGNTFIGAMGEWELLRPHNVYRQTAPSEGLVTRLRLNRFDPDRASLVVFNWDARPTVAVDLGAFLRDQDAFEIVDVQNYFAPPVLAARWTGQAVMLPMSGREPAMPAGVASRRPRHTGPVFGVFVVRRLPTAAS
ncbi:MAG: right-handed parallel beta-helix repeat-containing protein [Acidobacteria bacterium]|nr:right-handed parallel beta-helix repeat-containing protein [Acidobacteriota bacterium]